MPACYQGEPYGWHWWDVKLVTAVNFATNACGLSKEELIDPDKRWFWRFHLYYTVASTMWSTQTAIPGDPDVKVYDDRSHIKLWRNYMSLFKLSPKCTDYARDEGAVATYWDGK